MKKSVLIPCALLLSFLFITSSINAQWSNYKFGKISKQELEMTRYPNDTAASAVVLYHDGQTYYQTFNNQFRIVTEISKRIKILKPEGVDVANISFRLACSRSACDVYEKLEANAYNLENSKVVRSRLDKKYIFEEKASDYLKLVKFAIPNAVAGTVIEYKYTVISPFYYNIPTWFFQSEIPVQHARYEVLIPEYFQYNIESKGYEHINVRETAENQTFSFRTERGASNTPLNCTSRKIVYQMSDIPALKDDNHVWFVRDFMSSIRFELIGTRFPNDFYRPYAQTWENVDKTISENSDFNSYISRSNPYRREMNTLLGNITDEKEKISAILQFVKEKIEWDGYYALISNPAEAIRTGKGDNAQINYVLMSVLNDAGFKTCPVLLSRRSRGRLPMTYPSLDQLNTFVVMVTDSKGNNYFVDGSSKYAGLNMIPTDLLVDRARIYNKDISEKWIDLTTIGRNITVNNINASLSNDGLMQGTYSSIYNCQPALSMKNMFNNLKDSVEYVEELSNSLKVKIEDLKYEGIKSLTSEQITREIKFSKTNSEPGEFIYINPLIFTHISNNDFIQSNRKLPIEFNYPYSYRINCKLRLPENYKVEEMPASGRMSLNNNAGTFTYIIQNTDGVLEISYRVDINQTIFPHTDYESLKNFFAEIVSKNNAMVVLKKI